MADDSDEIPQAHGNDDATCTVTRQFKVRHERTGEELWGAHAWIIASRVIVIICAQEGDGLTERPRLETACVDLDGTRRRRGTTLLR